MEVNVIVVVVVVVVAVAVAVAAHMQLALLFLFLCYLNYCTCVYIYHCLSHKSYDYQPLSYLPTSRRVFEQPPDPFNYERVQQSALQSAAAQQFRRRLVCCN